MRQDVFGQIIFTENDIIDLYYQDPERKLTKVLTETKVVFDDDLGLHDIPDCILYEQPNISVKEFDRINSNKYLMPDEYQEFDIAKFVLDHCNNESELQRAGEELILFQERDMFPLLRYLKYLVDTMRANNIVWGVGRGSSVASFVLYLIGIHRINSLYYDLDIKEFIK